MTNGGDRGVVGPGRSEGGAGRGASGATSGSDVGDGVGQDHLRALSAVRAELTRLEEALCAGHHPVSDATIRVARAVAIGTARTRDTAQRGQYRSQVVLELGEGHRVEGDHGLGIFDEVAERGVALRADGLVQ